jgi:hypothetical protein
MAGAPIALLVIARRGRASTTGELALFLASVIQVVSFVVLLQVKSVDGNRPRRLSSTQALRSKVHRP